MSSIILYNYFRSSTSYRTRIALHYKELNFEYKAVHLLNDGGQQHKEEYKALNSMSEVPTLIHNNKALGQSMAIIEYLEECFPQKPLLPKDPVKRAMIRQFCENINSFIHPLGNLKVTQHLEKTCQFDDKKKQEWISHWSHKAYQALESMLRKEAGQFCFGDQVSMADLFLIPQMFSSKRFNVDLKDYPLCQKVNDNCLKLEAFKKAHPHAQEDTPSDLKTSL